jgi:hypothetical protein
MNDRRLLRRALAWIVAPIGFVGLALIIFAELRNPATNTSQPAAWTHSLGLGLLVALSGLTASLLAFPIAYLIARFLRRQGILEIDLLAELVDHAIRPEFVFIDRLEDMPWAEIFAPGNSVDCIARFLDHPLVKMVGQDQLTKFFGRGGRIRIGLPNPNDATLVSMLEKSRPDEKAATVESKDSVPLPLVENGELKTVDPRTLDRGPDAFRRIGSTITALSNANATSRGSKKRKASPCTIFYLDQLPNFFGLCVNGDEFYFSPYEHFFVEEFRSPIIRTRLKQHEDLKEFWKNEISALLRRPDTPRKTPLVVPGTGFGPTLIIAPDPPAEEEPVN